MLNIIGTCMQNFKKLTSEKTRLFSFKAVHCFCCRLYFWAERPAVHSTYATVFEARPSLAGLAVRDGIVNVFMVMVMVSRQLQTHGWNERKATWAYGIPGTCVRILQRKSTIEYVLFLFLVERDN